MLNKLLPRYAFFISGAANHADRLQAFERALLSAGKVEHNLVAVSSIFPANCKIISPEQGFKMLTSGEIVFCVMAKQDTNKKGEIVSASIGLAKTKDPKKFGYISEYHGTFDKDKADKLAKKLAIEMLARKFNIPVGKLDTKILQATTASIKQSAKGEWVCAVALCVFVL